MMKRVHGLFFLLLLSSGLGFSQPKVLVYYDMEGISGVTRHDEVTYGRPGYARGRELLTMDVNAAIAGLRAGGAGTIVVVDAHGSGNPGADIVLALLDPRAHFDSSSLRKEPYIDCIDSSYDAIVCIGMHARAFTNGFIAHTYSDDIGFNVNGVDFSEATLIAASAARFHIPVIMVSGDDVLESEIKQQLPTVHYATVRYSKGFHSCDTLPLAIARERIFSAAREAIGNLSTHRVLDIQAPFEFRISFKTKGQAKRAFSQKGLSRIDEVTVSFNEIDFADGFRRSLELMRLAHMSQLRFFLRSVFNW